MELERNYDAILIGPLGDPRVPDGRHAREIILGIRHKLDLYFGYQRIKVYDSWMNPLKNSADSGIDFFLIRENVESSLPKIGGNLYRGTDNEIATQSFLYTRRAVERFIRTAFQFARDNGRHRIVLVHKNTLMTHLHELWIRIFQETATTFPEAESEIVTIDTLMYDLLNDPGKFEVIVAPELIADLIADVSLFLQGGYGLAYISEINPGIIGTFRITQNSAVKMAGHNRANPFGAMLATIDLLRYLDLKESADVVEKAVSQTLCKHMVTIDMGGIIGTEEVGNYVCEFITEQLQSKSPESS